MLLERLGRSEYRANACNTPHTGVKTSMASTLLDAQRLREILDYAAATGIFRWRTPMAYKTKVGDIAGGPLRTGHIRIRIHPERYMAHRLARLYVHGEWPTFDVDHIDGNPPNNTI